MSVLPKLLGERRAVMLAAIILMQALCAVFFATDVVTDLLTDFHIMDPYILLEALAAVALAGGVGFLMLELRRIMTRMERLETATQAARGEMAEVIEAFFVQWGLTPSEREVAFLVLKGMENDDIARIRGTASGTVRAQCTAVYSKAGVDGRAQLFSVFMEELLAND